jgi:hypothetical protein
VLGVCVDAASAAERGAEHGGGGRRDHDGTGGAGDARGSLAHVQRGEEIVSNGASGKHTWQQIRQIFGSEAKRRGDYAGIPMPTSEAALVVSPRMPWHDRLHGYRLESDDVPGQQSKGEDPGDGVLSYTNSWYDHRNGRMVYVMQENGRAVHGFDYRDVPGARLGMMLNCMGISQTMDINAERKAMELLRSLIKPHLADGYEMTGVFLETSKRSGVTYVFRRLGTTIALRGSRILAALCLHPIAFYDGLPMGAMVPTDDVIAHLLMMRGDEVAFWKKSNQHYSLSPGAML